MSLIAEAAIASFLSPDADERREAAIAKRLDQQRPAHGAAGARRRHRRRDAGPVRPLLAHLHPAIAGRQPRRPHGRRPASATTASSPRSAGGSPRDRSLRQEIADDFQDHHKCQSASGYRHELVVTKPFEPQELDRVIAKALRISP